MRITFEQSGGFAGLLGPAVSVDTSTLGEHEQRSWQELVETAGFFQLPSEQLSARGADMVQYSVAIEDGSRRHRVRVDDMTLSPALASLIERLQEAGRHTG